MINMETLLAGAVQKLRDCGIFKSLLSCRMSEFELLNIRNVFTRNRDKVIKFFYLLGGSVFQLGGLNFIVFPFLSRHMVIDDFAQVLLLITIMNFYVTIFGTPIILVLYRRLGSMAKHDQAQYAGSLLHIMVATLFVFISFHMLLHRPIVNALHLTCARPKMAYALAYMAFLSVDAFLLAKSQFDFDFRSGFISRIIFFIGTLMTIPAYFAMEEHWMISLSAAPLLSISYLGIQLSGYDKMNLFVRPGLRLVGDYGKDIIMFLMTSLCASLLMYSDRWVVALLNVKKDELAYYLVAVQASQLVSFPVDRMTELMMPYVGQLPALHSLKTAQARKSIILWMSGVAFLATFGVLIGNLFFRLYRPEFLENAWRYFVVVLIAVICFTGYSFSRAYVLRFFSASYLILPFLAATVVQVTVAVYLLSIRLDTIGAAYARLFGFMTLGIFYLILCQRHVIKIAWSSRHDVD